MAKAHRFTSLHAVEVGVKLSVIGIFALGRQVTTNGLLKFHDNKGDNHENANDTPLKSVHASHSKDDVDKDHNNY